MIDDTNKNDGNIIIKMTVRIIVLILFVFKTPFYFVCLLHVTLVPTPSCNSNVFVPFFIFGIKRRKKKLYKICYEAFIVKATSIPVFMLSSPPQPHPAFIKGKKEKI